MTDASSIREGLAKLSGSSGDLTGIDPETITQVYKFDWTEGSDQTIRDLSGSGAIVEKQFADDEDLHVNDTFNLLSADGDETLLTVRGIYKAPPFYPLLGKASILQSSFDELYQRPENAFTFLNTRGGTNEAVKNRSRLPSPTSRTPRCRAGRSGSRRRTRSSTTSCSCSTSSSPSRSSSASSEWSTRSCSASSSARGSSACCGRWG